MTYNGFRIVCLGTYCLPRVIATVSHFKQRRAQGEKTCPFDLAFCWDFDGILNLLDNEFINFFNEVEYDCFHNQDILDDLNNIFGSAITKEVWKHEKAGIIFNHENYIPFEEFKTRYENRIHNLFEYIKETNNEVYFLIATFRPINEAQISRLNQIISRYRVKNSFYNIIINQSGHDLGICQKNTYVIDCEPNKYNEIFKFGWAEMFKDHQKYKNANEMYYKIVDEFKKIILKI